MFQFFKFLKVRGLFTAHTKGLIKLGILFLFLFLVFSSQIWAATYYSKTTGNANTLATWGLNADGTGTAPANFSTAGDLFILRSASTLGLNGNWIIGANVTLQIDGLLSVTSNNDDITIDGTVTFTNTTSTQVSLTGGGNNNDFILSPGATLKTANQNGIRGANCSLPTTASGAITLDIASNYEFDGSTNQATLGLPATVNNLTINNSGIAGNNTVTLANSMAITNSLTISNI